MHEAGQTAYVNKNIFLNAEKRENKIEADAQKHCILNQGAIVVLADSFSYLPYFYYTARLQPS